MADQYMLVGNCSVRQPTGKGLTVYHYKAGPDGAALSPVGSFYTDLNIGQQSFCEANGQIYATDEFWSQKGCTGGGGNVASFALDPETGTLTCTGFARSYAALPTYQCIDSERQYMIVTHHTTENFVTRLRKLGEGFGTETLFDDCVILLLRLNPDGSVGKACDAVTVPGEYENGRYRFPHLHCVLADHTGEYYVITDKGLGRLYVYAIDKQAGKLVKISTTDCPQRAEARYGVFDLQKQILYMNFESDLFLAAYALEPSGQLRLLGTEQLAAEGSYGENPMMGDIAIHPSGKWLYTTLREANLLAVLKLDGAGGMELVQLLSCGGKAPRGLCVAPDGAYVFCANTQSKAVFAFHVQQNGHLEPQGAVAVGGLPGNIQIITLR